MAYSHARGRHSGRPARPAKIHPDRDQSADFHPDRAGISHPDPGPSGRAEPDLSPIIENLIFQPDFLGSP